MILPVYNAGSYIGRCIESLRAQTLKDLEFIVVDDCSTDASMNAVDAWAAADKRVRILRNEENLGEGPSRNRGIEAARGDYLSTIDPDDYVAPDYYELLYAAATAEGGHDIAKGSCLRVDELGARVGPLDISAALNEQIDECARNGAPLYTVFAYEHTSAIYRRSLFEDASVRYGVSRNGADTTFLLRCCYQTEDIVVVEAAAYYYVQREESAVRGDGMKRTSGEIEALAEKFAFFDGRTIDGDAQAYLISQVYNCLARFQSLLGEGRVERADYETVAGGLTDILRAIPGAPEACAERPQLAELLAGRPLTMLGKRSPGEGQVRVSVVLPVYNVEEGIGRCIESLRAQLLDGLEFIFIDDCSTDTSMEAVEAWARQDERVRILKNERNLGAAPSRNAGIKAARGDYLSFVDPDDYLLPDFYQLLYSAASADGGHDIAKGRRKTVDQDGAPVRDGMPSLNDAIRLRHSRNEPLYAAFRYEHTTAIYRRNLLEDSKVRYGATRNAEDTSFLLRCCYQTEDIVLKESATYYYVQREGSAVHGDAAARTSGELDALFEQAAFLQEKGIDDAALAYLPRQALSCLIRFQQRLGEGCVQRTDYETVAERLAGILRDIPGAPEACQRWPQLSELLAGRPLTTSGLRAPGEGETRISVILPVRNSGAGIRRCIESLRAQLLDGLEFIFVDDCSTDGSLGAVEAWAAQDRRVRILRNESIMGAGPSRNAGIKAARGDYLSFVDADDYLSSGFYQLLYTAAIEGGHDIAKGACRSVKADGRIRPQSRLNEAIAANVQKGRPLFESFLHEHCTAIYHSSVLADERVRYGSSSSEEDTTFLLAYTLRTDDIVFAEDAVYYDVERSGRVCEPDATERFMGELDSLGEKALLLEDRIGNPQTQEYLRAAFSSYATGFYLWASDHPQAENSISDYAAKLMDTIEKAPALHFLQSQSSAYRALAEENVPLPDVELLPETRIVPGALTWIDFMIEHREADALYADDCAHAIVCALRRIAGIRGGRGAKEAYAQLMERMGMLPVNRRAALLLKTHRLLASKRSARRFFGTLKRKLDSSVSEVKPG